MIKLALFLLFSLLLDIILSSIIGTNFPGIVTKVISVFIFIITIGISFLAFRELRSIIPDIINERDKFVKARTLRSLFLLGISVFLIQILSITVILY